MDRFALDLAPITFGTRATKQLIVLINGRPLVELVRPIELPHAAAEGNPQLAGDYSPLVLWDIDRDGKHFLGQPVATWFEDGDTVLMGCPCGEWGCWPLTVQIEVNAQTVRWAGFRNGHRDWDLSDLGPFEFDRVDYEAAVSVIG